MNAEPPVRERALPTYRCTQIRAAVMADAVPVPRTRRVRTGWLAAAVLAVLVGSGFLVWTRTSAPLVAAPAPIGRAGDPVIETDLGPLTQSQSRTTLATCRRRENPAAGQIISARRLTDGRKPFSWVAYRNADDQVAVCSDRLSGPTYGGDPTFRPSPQYPVVGLGGMVTASWLPDQTTTNPTTATEYSTAQFFAAGTEVATVQLRAVTSGQAGAWFAGSVHNGFVFVPLFDAGPVPLNSHGEPELTFERRAFDGSGSPVSIR